GHRASHPSYTTLFRSVVHRGHELAQLRADGPVERFGPAALVERQVAAIEEVERHVERLLRVVEALERVACRQVLVRLFEIDEGRSEEHTSELQSRENL